MISLIFFFKASIFLDKPKLLKQASLFDHSGTQARSCCPRGTQDHSNINHIRTVTAWSCHSTQKYVSEKRGHAQQISSLPTVNKICPWIYSSFQCGINEFWVWVTHGSAHREVGSWAAFHSHAPRPGSTTTGRVPTPFSGQWNFWKILQFFNAGLGKCPEFWLWQCYELLFFSLHWAVTVTQKKSQSSCQDMPHSRVSPLDHVVSARSWKFHLTVLCVYMIKCLSVEAGR